MNFFYVQNDRINPPMEFANSCYYSNYVDDSKAKYSTSMNSYQTMINFEVKD
jgi:hypothetical protein